MNPKTPEQYDKVINACRTIYINKMKDYGPTWRTMRPITVINQIFIKGKRIREIETTGVNLVGESVEDAFQAIVNYSVMGLVQQEKGYADYVDMEREEALKLYDKHIAFAKELMLKKNHDYGEAWRDMDTEAITDMIYNKILRNKNILANNGKTISSEGVEGNYYDIINYAVFNLIKLQHEE